MKKRTVLATLVGFFAGLALYAADPQMGTWKLNEAKSKLAPSGAKNNVVMISGTGDNIKVTVDGVDWDGKTFHSEWTGKYDGTEHAVKGDPLGASRSYTQKDANTVSFTGKKGGKTIFTGTSVVSADGKTRTVTASATDQGKTLSTTSVYDKQ